MYFCYQGLLSLYTRQFRKGKDIGDLYIPLQYPVRYQIELMVNIILARVQLSLVLLR